VPGGDGTPKEKGAKSHRRGTNLCLDRGGERKKSGSEAREGARGDNESPGEEIPGIRG